MSLSLGIDLMKLYAQGSHVGWNTMLNQCYLNRDTDRLARLRRELQIGMNQAVKRKETTDQLNQWFLRLQRSIEQTAKKIIREKNPSPLDNSLLAKDAEFGSHTKWKALKKKRDDEFELWLRKSSY